MTRLFALSLGLHLLTLSASPTAADSAFVVINPDGEANGDWFGGSVGSAADFDSDGYDDVIVGAENAAGDFGRAYVFLGGPSFDDVPDFTFTGSGFNERFGYAVAGDWNDDGDNDLIIGASSDDVGGTLAGQAYVFFGGTVFDSVPDVTFTGEAAIDFFGTSVAGGGDFNDDGYPDVIIGATDNDFPAADAAYIYFGGSGADSIPDLVIRGPNADEAFGFRASAGPAAAAANPLFSVELAGPSRLDVHVYDVSGRLVDRP